MSWTTVIWTISATICLTFAVLYITVWLRQRNTWENLLFAVAAAAAAVIAILELNLLHAPTPAAYGETLRWMHVSAAVLSVSLVWFLHVYLKAGRRLLAWIYTGLRILIQVPNFLFYPNATFSKITSIQHVIFMGESFSIPIGEMNPWRVLVLISNLVLLIYVMDATFTAWKHGNRSRALVLGFATLLALILSVISSELMTRGILPGAFISLNFLLIVLAMAYELSMDLIRARKVAQDLYETQQRMSLAARAANLEMWEWDVVRDEVWATRTASETTGIDATDRVKRNRYLEIIHPDDQERIREAVSHAMESDGNLQAEFRIVSPDGDIRWLSVCGQAEYGINGKPLLLRGVSRDITESKFAEVELQNHRNELAHIARVTSLGQLSSALAHEINQPLGAILRNAEAAELFLKQTPPDLEELQAILTDIRNDEQRAVSVIERMRLLLKRRELQLEALAVNELISEVAKLLNSEIQTRHASLRIDIAGELPKVYGDRVHLQQVILNLLLNSLDALNGKSEQQRQIVIRASQTTDGMVEFVVVDHGTGVAPEQLPHLFEPFYTTKKNGMGVGLAISKTIVEMHGGKIMAKNNPDGGATVRFTLRVVEQEDQP